MPFSGLAKSTTATIFLIMSGSHRIAFNAATRKSLTIVCAKIGSAYTTCAYAPAARGCRDRIGDKLKLMGAFIDPASGCDWMPVITMVFEDPDGIRLEVNFIHGKGACSPMVRQSERRSGLGQNHSPPCGNL